MSFTHYCFQDRMSDLTGQHFGLLAVMGKDDTKLRPSWLCRCLCGKEHIAREDHLVAGRTKSCGCASNRFKKAQMAKRFNLINRRFGSLQIVWRVPSKKIGTSSHSWWAAKCDCGKLIEVQGKALVSGRKTHCGCKTEKAMGAKA
jgi:hypothetical protein